MNERRILYLLIALLLGQLVLIATQVAEEDHQESLLERSLLRALAPVAHGISSVTKSVGSAGERLETRASLTEENERMAAELEALRLEVFRLRNVERLVDRLAQAVEYSPPRGFDVQVADVVYADASTRLGTLLLFIGDLPVRKDQPVVAPGGLVGRVILVAGSYAKVQLLTDRSATVGAMIERTRRQGIIRSGLEGELTLDYVPLQDDVQVGDQVPPAVGRVDRRHLREAEHPERQDLRDRHRTFVHKYRHLRQPRRYHTYRLLNTWQKEIRRR